MTCVPEIDHFLFALADIRGVYLFPPKACVHSLVQLRGHRVSDVDGAILLADRLEAGAVGEADDAAGFQTGEISDPQSLNISTRLNGQTLQQGNTRDRIFPVAETIDYVSQLFTLEPGDIIATGPPDRVGFKRTPPMWSR